MTNQNFIPDDDFIEEYLQEPLTPEKKAHLAQMREEGKKRRQEMIEYRKNNQFWKFLVADWSKQGCGRNIMLMMTQANPEGCDFDLDGDNPFTAINTKEERAINKFKEVFGEYYTQDVKFITENEFFTKYAQYLPPSIIEVKDELCSTIEYHSKLHIK
jgi:hypothetical protein